ncbi:MAG: DNA topoisomerase VI subunit B, partial [Candidatus Heimdallarchaeota archaeon]|nr:DNA topoisomerase VI subunit B [Candidatus Heimdallarchaeota archaeon]
MNDQNSEIEELIPDIEVDTDKSSKKSRSKEPKRDSKARTASAAVFFNENKSIAGFGNSMRAVFTSVRELVENSLDASEKRGVTPRIFLTIRKLEKKELIALMGGTSSLKTQDAKIDFIEMSCRDNGIGVSRDLIPQLFGTVLAGTKYGAQQTRGRFGLGSKMVLLYAMSTLDLPIQITTRPIGEDTTYRVKLFINLEKNEPIIHSDEKFVEGDDEYFDEYGTEIKVSFTGSWNLAKLYVREYFKQLAIITPYTDLYVKLPSDENPGFLEDLNFLRVVDDLPKPPEVVKIHPWGTDISTFRREMTHAEEDNLIDFLSENFMGVTPQSAELFFEEVGVDGTKNPKDLTSQEIRRIVHDGFNRALKESKVIKRKRDRVFKFDEPRGDALSPLGAARLRKGLEKELAPDFVEALTRPPRAYEGHPFVIEAAIGYGGGVNAAAASKGVTIIDNRVIYRFANRIPLVFGAGSDLITNIANSINWSEYGLTRATEPLAIAVSLVSTKIPFPETSKEYIDKVEEIGAEVKLTLLQLARKLKTYLGRRRRRQREKQRKSRFERFAPQTVHNLLDILEKENLWNPTTGINPSRIIAALSSGKPRIDSTVVPRREYIYQAPIWSNDKTQKILQSNEIFEVATFIKTDIKEIARLLKVSEESIITIKKRTIDELEASGQIPNLNIDTIISPSDEKRFHKRDDKEKLVELPRLSKSLNRRWIRNVYDFLVPENAKLTKVQGLAVKLVEAERVQVINRIFSDEEDDDDDDLSLFFDDTIEVKKSDSHNLNEFFAEEVLEKLDNLTDSPSEISEVEETLETPEELKQVGTKDLTIEFLTLLPPLEDLYDFDPVKKRKISTLLEFLLETTHPSSPLDFRVMAPMLVKSFQDNLKALVQTYPEYGKIKVDVSSQKWIDGYLRNAFKRRKISTVQNILETELDKLLEINELQRTLYSNLMVSLIPKEGTFNPVDYKGKDAEVKVKLLQDAGIYSLEKFASTPSQVIVDDINLKEYIHLLVEEAKMKLISELTISNNLGSLSNLKEIPRDLEDELDRLAISNTMDLLITPIEKFDPALQSRIILAKSRIGKSPEVLLKKHQKALKDVNVAVLEEIIFNADYYLQKEIPETVKSDLNEVIELLNLPVSLISSNLVVSFDVLRDAGITNAGKFLVWPSRELSRVLDTSEEWIKLLNDSFDVKELKNGIKNTLKPISTISQIIGEECVRVINDMGISSIQEAAQVRWGDVFPKSHEKWKIIGEMDQILTGELGDNIDDIEVGKSKDKSTLIALIKELEKQGIDSLLQFIKLPTQSLTTFANTKKKRDLIEQLSSDLKSFEPSLVSTTSKIYKASIAHYALEKLRSPIVYLSGFETREIEKLNHEDIQTLHQLFTTDEDQLAKILNISKTKLKEKIDSSVLQTAGTLISVPDEKGNLKSVITFEREGISFFQPEEIASLNKSGYNSIEALYYLSDHRTFEVSGISWEIVNHFKKLLQSPPVIITWKKMVRELVVKTKQDISEHLLFDTQLSKEKDVPIVEDSNKEPEYVDVAFYETFSSKELEFLTKANITRVIDFLTTNSHDMSEILGWDQQITFKKQTSVILQEAGISLGDLEIFRPDHLTELSEMGLITIEDLYFTAKKETWDSSLVDFDTIQTVKNVLHLHLQNVVEELSPEMVEILVANGVETILELILTGNPILEQKTKLPAERFENLKYAIDFGALIEAFDKTVLFTPGINYFQAKKLMNAGYNKILDLVIGDVNELSSILDMSVDDVQGLLDLINRENIFASEEERGILLRDLQAFSRQDVRSIAKSGVFEMNDMDTLQEVLYQVTEFGFQGEGYLKELVLDLQKVCKIDIKKIGDITEKDVKKLNQQNIFTISDVLLINYEDLASNVDIDSVLTNVTRFFMDLRPFLAMARMPMKVAMVEGDSEDNLLDGFLTENNLLHKRTMRNIRTLLSIPIRLTSFIKSYQGNVEEFAEKTVSDAILEYVPDDLHPNAQLKKEILSQGSIIKLLKEGSTPITLLDLDASEFMSLVKNSFNTIEKLVMYDPKMLADLTGSTQKYWRDIKDIFDPEMFQARLGDIGIPVSTLDLSEEQKSSLVNFEIDYLDQIIAYDRPSGFIKELSDFLYSSSIFLVGSPGEREIAINLGAQSIIDSVIALRKYGARSELINDAINLAWQSYTLNRFDVPTKIQKDVTKLGVNSLQDLISLYQNNPKKFSSKWLSEIEMYMKSPLLLPLPSSELKEIVLGYRCTTVIEALSSPMTVGKISKLKEEIREQGSLQILNEISVDLNLLKLISKATWNKFENTKFSLQDLISSPRTINEYNGIKQKFLSDARSFLHIPLTQIHINGNQILLNNGIHSNNLRLDDLIFALPELYGSNKTDYDKINNNLNSPDLVILSEVPIAEELKKSAETALGVSINGFHDFWIATWEGHNLLSKIKTTPSMTILNFINKVMLGLDSIQGITPLEIWSLWKSGFTVIADILLSPVEEIPSDPPFTKKRVREIRNLISTQLENELIGESVKLSQIMKVLGKELVTDTSLATILHNSIHPLVRPKWEEIGEIIKNRLEVPLITSSLGMSMDQNSMKKILSLGIVSISDLIYYPQSLKRLPEDINDQEYRFTLIKDITTGKRQSIKLTETKFPAKFIEILGKNSTVEDAISNALAGTNAYISTMMRSNLKYSSYTSDELKLLQNNNITTVMELYLLPPSELASILEIDLDSAMTSLKNLDIEGIQNKILTAPLQIKDTTGISDKTKVSLSDIDIHTYLDLVLPISSKINKPDANYMTNIINILNAPASILLYFDEFSREDLVATQET